MMNPILGDFETFLNTISLNKPRIPYISNITGDWITARDTANPGYWVTHLKETVRFADGIKQLMKEPNPLFIEIGPGRDLSALLVRHKEEDDNSRNLAVSLIKPAKDMRNERRLFLRFGFLPVCRGFILCYT